MRRLFIDHYLQGALLARLAASGGPLRFSELKEDGIDNSLFMYHANKLISRGAIEKSTDGFHLTANGARWVNAVGPDMWQAKPTPRPLVQLVITYKDTLLLSSRKGQLKEHLNEYMFPGGLHKQGMTADENAQRITRQLFGQESFIPEFLAVVESINSYADEFVYHSVSHVFQGDLATDKLPEADDRFDFEWVPLHVIRIDNPQFQKSQFVPLFLEKIQSGTLQPREVIQLEYK